MPTTSSPIDLVPLCEDCIDCIPLAGLEFDFRPTEDGETCGADDHDENVG